MIIRKDCFFKVQNYIKTKYKIWKKYVKNNQKSKIKIKKIFLCKLITLCILSFLFLNLLNFILEHF